MSQELEGTLTNSANLTGTFGSEGGGGTSNYNDLINKPSINSVTLQGNKTASQLGFAEVATSGDYNDLTNKPTIPAAQVNSDWNATSGVAEILNKPTLSAVATSGDYDDLTNKPSIPAAQVNSDWNATSGVAEILNKPTIPAAQVNSDWNSTSGVSEILNKPTVYQNAAALPISANDSTDTKTYIDNATTATTPTITVTKNSGAWGFSNVTAKKYGGVVNLALRITGSNTAVASGSDGFSGSINTLKPNSDTYTITYYGANLFVIRLTSTGDLYVRNVNSNSFTLPTTDWLNVSLTYLV